MSTSSISTSVPASSRPNSNLVSAMIMPLASAMAAASLVDGDADVADLRGQLRADDLHHVAR